ncbi:hypothetical protein C7I55_12685 [Sphingomonas deserti]|uniref:DUF2241 domain-containing protein n=2 Tax=Allosphingosinicella deserti TaxID=2116704 RepID=A0A2P7QPT1_9SPHN|nr:hypothetical protein C7I55_12685 [Sphingomonas deserti]
MIAAMTPLLREGEFIFCSTRDAALADRCWGLAVAMFMEAEGHSFVLALADALELGFDCAQPMRQITLGVHSALDGVGLTAAVSAALAACDIPCNVIAAYHHDHLFVPAALAEPALAALDALQTTYR